jgi:hypothetical protein
MVVSLPVTQFRHSWKSYELQKYFSDGMKGKQARGDYELLHPELELRRYAQLAEYFK